ncbi:CGA synthase-related protein [Kitasatospora sp. NPDC005751]|uniref:CGA synthase-related protein n=1 Tax=Kitasatospora sp. NPDC005751 TaxID=3157064 RepID=UPI0033D2F545
MALLSSGPQAPAAPDRPAPLDPGTDPATPTRRTPAGSGSAAAHGSPQGPRVLLSARPDQLDSTLALRRVAAHLGDLRPVGAEDVDPPPVAALVCDDVARTEHLLGLGVPVVHLISGHPVGGPATEHLPAGTPAAGTPAADNPETDAPPERALGRVHRPGWLPAAGPAARGVRPTGVLAPQRTGRSRSRSGTLLLLSLWRVPAAEAEAFAGAALPALVAAALHRTGGCTVVADTGLDLLRSALGGLTGRPGLRLGQAAETDPDALHAEAGVFLASPVLGALALAQARRAPLALLPALGPAQRALAEQLAGVLPLPSAEDPADPGLWAQSGAGGAPAAGPWHLLDPALDDLRGAQRVARTLRQLALAPL